MGCRGTALPRTGIPVRAPMAAPFHYGRWLRLSTGWAWVPGTRVARPVYAPALVAFIGGTNWNASFAFGSAPVAWFPLGPREVFVPAYRVSPVYVQQVNVAHVTNVTVTNIHVTNVYVNQTVPGAVTAVSRDTFVRAQPVAAAAVAVPHEQTRVAPVVGAAPAVGPQAASLASLGRGPVAAPPAAVATRPVIARRAPPPPPVPFAQQQQTLGQQPGPLVVQPAASVPSQTEAGRPTHPLVRTVTSPQPSPSGQPTPNSSPATGRPPGSALSDRGTLAGSAPHTPVASQAPPTSPGALTTKDLAVRQQREREAIDQRHAQERWDQQARHQQELQAAASSSRTEIQRRHQAEREEMQARHDQERKVLQQHHSDERKPQGNK